MSDRRTRNLERYASTGDLEAARAWLGAELRHGAFARAEKAVDCIFHLALPDAARRLDRIDIFDTTHNLEDYKNTGP